MRPASACLRALVRPSCAARNSASRVSSGSGAGGARHREPGRHARRGRLLGERLQRLGQRRVEARAAQRAHRAPHLGQRRLRLLLRLGQHRVGGRCRRQHRTRGLDLHLHDGERVPEPVVDVAGHPVALLRRGQLLGLQGVVAQLLVGRDQGPAGLLLAAQQLGDHGREHHGRQRAEPLAQPVPPRHPDVHHGHDQDDHDGVRQGQQQHALADQHDQEQRRARAGVEREHHTGQREHRRDVGHRPGPLVAAVDPGEPDGGEHGVQPAQHHREDGLPRADDADHQREEGATRQHGESPDHGSTLGGRAFRVKPPRRHPAPRPAR